MQSRAIELAVGIFVAAGLAALVLLAMQVSNLSAFSNDEGYSFRAKFSNIGGLKVRSQVTVAGVKIGRVTGVSLDPDKHDAVVTMQVGKRQKIPVDSLASIYTAGLLGEQFIAILPGKSADLVKDGGEIARTEPSVVLEKLLGDFFSRSNVRGFDNDNTYRVHANFRNIGSLQTNSAIALGGITVGRVADIRLDPKRYEAVVVMAINKDVPLPVDTSAAIMSASLLGGQYISLEPGAEEDNLKDGDAVTITQSAIVLEKLISEYMFNTASGDKGTKK